MGPGHRRRVLIVGALSLIVVLAVASGSGVLRPALVASRGIVQRVGAAHRARTAMVAPANLSGSPVRAASPASIGTPPAKAPGPVASANRSLAPPTPSPTTPAAPTAAPTATLEEFWQRYRSYEYDSLLDQLKILPADQRDDPLFGVNDALTEESAAAPIMHGVGAAVDRVEVRWDEVEPAAGEFRFDRLDRLVAAAEMWHLSIVAVVDGAPTWAVDRKERVGAGPPKALDAPIWLDNGEANPANPWAYFLWTLARHYGDRVEVWEIWNEPNFHDYWHGSADDYARLVAVARMVLHRTNPGASVLLGGMVQDDGSFLRAVVRNLCDPGTCAGQPFDGVAWHVYGDPSDLLRIVDLTHAILAPAHIAAPIWVTEANVAVDDPHAPGDLVVGPDAVSLSQQAAFVLQLYALARASGVHTVAFYRATDVDEGGHYWGLLREGLTARPALFAYRTAAEWLSHAEFVQLSHPAPGVTQVTMRRRDQNVNVLWNDAAHPIELRLPIHSTTALLIQCTGATSQLQPSTGAVAIRLPAAPARRPRAAPLGQPVVVVTDQRGNLKR